MSIRAPLAFAAGCLVLLVSAAPAAGVQRQAFVTSVRGTGDLHSWPDAGGLFALAAADNICRERAAAGGLPNASTYRAWMSTAATDAYCHVQGQTGKRTNGCVGSPQPAGPWYLVAGSSAFAGGLDELTGPGRVIYRGVLQDEFGEFLADTDPTSYWTGTLPDGSVAPETCASWVVGQAGATGATGDALRSAVEWTRRFASGCETERRLLCLEPGASDPVSAFAWSPAALAFVTSARGNGNLSSWLEAGGEAGLAAGDAICRRLASDARLPAPESYVAFLSTSTVDARDRLTLENAPIRRPDHVAVAGSKADLLDGTNDNSLHADESGAYLESATTVFTGSLADGTPVDGPCDDWTATSQSGNARAGSAAAHRSGSWASSLGTSCSVSARLYCFSNVVTLFWDGFDRTGDTSRWSSSVP